jgi:hypothetical protein
MTQTRTAANGTTILELAAPDGWASVTAYQKPGMQTWKIIAISSDRKSAVHRDKRTDAQLLTFDPDVETGRKPQGPAIPLDIMAQLGASIDAAKAAR